MTTASRRTFEILNSNLALKRGRERPVLVGVSVALLDDKYDWLGPGGRKPPTRSPRRRSVRLELRGIQKTLASPGDRMTQELSCERFKMPKDYRRAHGKLETGRSIITQVLVQLESKAQTSLFQSLEGDAR